MHLREGAHFELLHYNRGSDRWDVGLQVGVELFDIEDCSDCPVLSINALGSVVSHGK